MKSLNSYFTEKGYSGTKLQRKMIVQGGENNTTLQDTMKFLKSVYENHRNQRDSAMLEIMKRQQVKTKMPSQLEVPVENKIGELQTVENDIRSVLSDETYELVVLTNDVSNYQEVRVGIGSLVREAKK